METICWVCKIFYPLRKTFKYGPGHQRRCHQCHQALLSRSPAFQANYVANLLATLSHEPHSAGENDTYGEGLFAPDGIVWPSEYCGYNCPRLLESELQERMKYELQHDPDVYTAVRPDVRPG